jgi:protein TonB
MDYLAQVNQRGPGNTRRHDAPELALGAGEFFLQSDLKLAAAFRPLPPALQQLFQSAARHSESTRDILISSTAGQRPAADRSAPHPGNRPSLLTRLVPPSRVQGIDSRAPIVTLPQLHGKHPQQRAETTNTRASVFAPYLEAWRERIEVVGNTHYSALVPPQIKRGHVTLTITLNADGSIQSIRPVPHSHYPELDAAALKIIRLAAPFPPFPPVVRKRTERLTFTYQWNFIRGRETPGSIGLNPRN